MAGEEVCTKLELNPAPGEADIVCLSVFDKFGLGSKINI